MGVGEKNKYLISAFGVVIFYLVSAQRVVYKWEFFLRMDAMENLKILLINGGLWIIAFKWAVAGTQSSTRGWGLGAGRLLGPFGGRRTGRGLKGVFECLYGRIKRKNQTAKCKNNGG